MTDLLRPILETLVIISGMIFAYLPVQSYLKQRPLKLIFLLFPLLAAMSVTGGLLSYVLHISTFWAMAALILSSMCIYIKTLSISVWKSGSVFLAVIAVFSCINSLSRAINAYMTAQLNLAEDGLWFCFRTGLLYNFLCCAYIAISWYPATHAARNLIEDHNLPVTWKIFWVLPIVFISVNLFMVPRYPDTLYTGRIMQGYIVISLVLLVLLSLFYAMLLMIAGSLNKNVQLQHENQFLAMQQSRYDNLKAAIEETRQARHDLRHHFTHLSAMAADGDLETIKKYLTAAQNNIPDMDMCFSNNRAADSIIGYYCALAQREGIPFLPKISLPAKLPVEEMNLCSVLSNLLENALEASLRTAKEKRRITVTAYLYSERLILIQVQNTFDGKIKEKDGIFKSSKHKGDGIGIQSVRRTAEKNGGDSDFVYTDTTFTAKVMLRG